MQLNLFQSLTIVLAIWCLALAVYVYRSNDTRAVALAVEVGQAPAGSYERSEEAKDMHK